MQQLQENELWLTCSSSPAWSVASRCSTPRRGRRVERRFLPSWRSPLSRRRNAPYSTAAEHRRGWLRGMAATPAQSYRLGPGVASDGAVFGDGLRWGAAGARRSDLLRADWSAAFRTKLNVRLQARNRRPVTTATGVMKSTELVLPVWSPPGGKFKAGHHRISMSVTEQTELGSGASGPSGSRAEPWPSESTSKSLDHTNGKRAVVIIVVARHADVGA